MEEGNSPVKKSMAKLQAEYASDHPVCLYLQALGEVEPLAPGEEEGLLRQIAAGDRQAKERLMDACLHLVVAIAAEYRGKGLHILDLIQAGNAGLNRAAEDFDWTAGSCFSSYASGKIHRAISRECATSCIQRHIPKEIPVKGKNFCKNP